ncbi:hypothetical protein V7114_26815 [Neobacillus niacini]|uniref:hypothetical protein n=1 Tax=Neobacillus niacini TaxID=86668 RepID=UPI002FFF3308
MKGLKILSFLIAVLAVGSIGFYFTDFIMNGNKAERSSIVDQVKEDEPNESNDIINASRKFIWENNGNLNN